MAHAHLSRGLAFAGCSDEAIKHGEAAIRLSPLDPEVTLFRGSIAIAHYAARRFDKSLRLTEENLSEAGLSGKTTPELLSLAHAGRIEEAVRSCPPSAGSITHHSRLLGSARMSPTKHVNSWICMSEDCARPV